MFKSISTSLITRGILAVIIGIIAVVWPGVTILALVVLFAIYAFMDAILEGMRAFSSRDAGPVAGHLLLALVDLAAGVVALVWPGPTALVLVIVVAVWAFAVTLALLFGLYSLIFGVSEITPGVELRHSGGKLRPVMQDAA